MATYEKAVSDGNHGPDEDLAALELYAWNAAVSGAFMMPLHICEVSLRNAVSDALEAVYGPQWPWEAVFEYSLPSKQRAYSPKRDLISARDSLTTVGQVIPELKFAFWQHMFTGRHDTRLWNAHLLTVMPNLDATQPVSDLRLNIHGSLETIRRLRNRIAHHEPIFSHDLVGAYKKILELVAFRCATTAKWLEENQKVMEIIALQPQPQPEPEPEPEPELTLESEPTNISSPA